MTADPVALAQALIRCRSVTPAEGGALTLLADALREGGFAVEQPVFSEPGTPDIVNLYARYGQASPCLVFAGHTDVVPAGDEAAWRFPPFAGNVDDGRLYGRGAVDMKGAVAASVAAALAFVAQHGRNIEGSIVFLLTGDEEGPAVNGTVKLLAWAQERGERFDACLLGEPTSAERFGDTAKIGRRGSLTGSLVVHGRQGHVAYPHLADNPIPRLVRLMAALDATPLDSGTDHFAPSNLEWTSVDVGNPATNVIPAEARATFNIRFNDRWTAETLADEIRVRLAAVPNVGSYDLAFVPSNSPAFLTEPGAFVDLVSMAVAAETGIRPELSTSGGTSDARFIKDYCPVVEFGPLNGTMHATDECVAVDDLRALTRIYRRVIDAMLMPDLN